VLVIGIGNPILGDDGVGWQVAGALERRLAADARLAQRVGRVDVDRLDLGGLRLMEHLVGYPAAILVDASCDGKPVGTVSCAAFGGAAARDAAHLDSAHDTSLSTAIAAGRALGADLPHRLDFVGVSVDARHLGEFSEELSVPVAAAVPRAVEVILGLLARGHDA
jgi:hydrogenase maturation protease